MFSLIVVFFASFVLSLLLTPLCRNFAVRFGIVDTPDEARKVHRVPVPRIGGVPLMLAYLAAGFLLVLSPLAGGDIVAKGIPFAVTLVPAVVVIFLTGLLDDLFGLRPWQKLAGQVVAATLAWLAGVQIHGVGALAVPLWASALLTVLWLVGAANAVNLIDGVDGLATGVGLFATLTTLVASLIQNNHPLALAVAPLAGALFAFLRYNFNPASIFLGDSGSLTIGFLLGCFSVIWSQKTATLLGMTAPLLALSVPLLDTAISIARRALRGQPIFGADRGHIHHRLLDRGFTPRRVALLLYGICGLGAALSLLQSTFHRHWGPAIIILFCAGAWVGIQHLGYAEFSLAGRLLRPRNFQRILDAQVRLRALESDLQAAASVEQCWVAVCRSAQGLGFSWASMHLEDVSFEAEFFNGHSRAHCWTLHAPVSSYGFVEVGLDFGASLAPMVVAPFAETVYRVLPHRLDALRPSLVLAPVLERR